MEKVIMGTRLPAKLWLDEVEDSCMSQIMDLTSLPFAFKHIAIMPDAHAGKGMPIGGDRKSTRLNSSHTDSSRMPSSA